MAYTKTKEREAFFPTLMRVICHGCHQDSSSSDTPHCPFHSPSPSPSPFAWGSLKKNMGNFFSKSPLNSTELISKSLLPLDLF